MYLLVTAFGAKTKTYIQIWKLVMPREVFSSPLPIPFFLKTNWNIIESLRRFAIIFSAQFCSPSKATLKSFTFLNGDELIKKIHEESHVLAYVQDGVYTGSFLPWRSALHFKSDAKVFCAWKDDSNKRPSVLWIHHGAEHIVKFGMLILGVLFKIINTDFKLLRYTFEIKFWRRYYYARMHTFVNSMETFEKRAFTIEKIGCFIL